MDLVNGFGRASPGFGSDPPTGSGRVQGSPQSSDGLTIYECITSVFKDYDIVKFLVLPLTMLQIILVS